MLENLDKIMHLRFNFDACPMHAPFGFVHLTHQNLSARALFCLNSFAKVNTQLSIYNYFINVFAKNYVVIKLLLFFFFFIIIFIRQKKGIHESDTYK